MKGQKESGDGNNMRGREVKEKQRRMSDFHGREEIEGQNRRKEKSSRNAADRNRVFIYFAERQK